MVFNKPFQHPPSAIASFTYTEISSGLGFIKYFLMETEDSGGVDYALNEDVRYSSAIELAVNGVETKETNFFSSAFNAARTAKGTANINIGFDTTVTAGPTCIVSVQITKFDGTTTTNISSAITLTLTAIDEGVLSFEIPITQTRIKIGEQLKLIVILTQNGAGKQTSIGIDPQNRDGPAITPSNGVSITSSNINIPFLIIE